MSVEHDVSRAQTEAARAVALDRAGRAGEARIAYEKTLGALLGLLSRPQLPAPLRASLLASADQYMRRAEQLKAIERPLGRSLPTSSKAKAFVATSHLRTSTLTPGRPDDDVWSHLFRRLFVTRPEEYLLGHFTSKVRRGALEAICSCITL